MQYKLLIFTALFLIFESSLWAQTDFAWISTGKVRARITPTGIHRDAEGGFLLEKVVGQPPKNLLSHLTPWVVGVDPGYNLKLACEMNDPMVSDWKAGFRGIENSDKLWKVTIEQIEMHINDFKDNGVIDNPIPEIYAWPGKGNPFSQDLNGFSTDSIHFSIDAPFEDFNFDGIYTPQTGDFPYEQFGVDPQISPQVLIYSPFYDDGENKLTHGTGLEINSFFLAYTLDCQEQDFVENTIFFEYGGFYNSGFDRLDSLYLGIYADFDIGSPNDDYLGCIPELDDEMVFCYNSDTLMDVQLGAYPPMVSLNCFSFSDIQNSAFLNLSHFIPLYPSGFPVGTQMPSTPYEYYNFITGNWRDGTPLTSGGTGYNIGMASPPANLAFPDTPTNPDGWSELSENNPMGNRKAILSYGPTKIKPLAHQSRLVYSLTASERTGFTQQIKHLTEMRDLQSDIEYGWDGNNPLHSICFPTLLTKNIDSCPVLCPNPVQNYLIIKTTQTVLQQVFLINSFGQNIQIDTPQITSDNEIQISLKNLPAGIYFLHWTSKDGRRGCEKVVKN